MSNRKEYVRHGIGSVRPSIQGPVALPEFVKKCLTPLNWSGTNSCPESFHVEMQIDDAVPVIKASELPPDVSPWVGAIDVYVERCRRGLRSRHESGRQAARAAEGKLDDGH